MKRIFLLLAVAVFSLSFLSLSTVQAQEEGGQSEAPARVRVVHASPDAPEVNIQVNGETAFGNVAFGAISDYTELPADTYNVSIRSAVDDSFILSANLELQAGTDYTVVALGRAADIAAQLFIDNNELPPEGSTKVRFIHASPDAPAVDIAVRDGPVLFENVAFGTVGDYLTADAGSYDLIVYPTGSPSTIALEVPGVPLDSGIVYTVLPWAY